ncbi:MAG: transporter [Bacteroidetes bacterium]|nr:transporter [Bacteroidota bacterium]
MKNFTLIMIALFFYLNGHGQTEKGTFQIGIGGLPIISLAKNSFPVGYSSKAYLGYFPAKKLAVGIMPYLGKVDATSYIGANAYVRYYLSDKNLSLFLEATTGIVNLKYGDASQSKETLNTITIGPGVHYLFNKRLSVELHLQYARLTNIFEEGTGHADFFAPSIGIQYFIGRKTK